MTIKDNKRLPVILKPNGMAFKRSGVQFSLAPPSNDFNRLGSKSWPVFLYEKSDIQEGVPTGGWDEGMEEVEQKGEMGKYQILFYEENEEIPHVE